MKEFYVFVVEQPLTNAKEACCVMEAQRPTQKECKGKTKRKIAQRNKKEKKWHWVSLHLLSNVQRCCGG